MPITDLRSVVPSAPDAALDAAPQGGNSFTQGLRSGMTAAGGQLRALAGGVGEALGADQFAREQYAKSLADQREAAAQAPEINSYKQVLDAPDLSTGLRRAGSYVAGQLGQAAPLVGAGLAAGGVTALTGGGALPAFAAATAAAAPFTTGQAIEQQQADPQISLRHGAGARLAAAAGEGLAGAALSNAVPMAFGGKLLGRAAEDVVAKRALPAILGNTAEGVGGNAAAGAATEKLHQAVASELNPNRDTSGDDEALKEAAIGGAVVGAPFAAAGVAGDLRGKLPEAGVADQKLGSIAQSVKDFAKNQFGAPEAKSSAPVDLAAKLDDLKNTLTPEPVTGDDHAVQMGLAEASPDQHEQLFAKADDAAVQKAQRTVANLTGSEFLTPQEHEQLGKLDPTKPDDQMALSALNAQAFERKTKSQSAMSLADDMAQRATPDAEGVQRSNAAATPQEVYGFMDRPEFSYLTAPAKKAVASALPRVVDLAENGQLTGGDIQRLSDTLGEHAASALEQAQKVTGSSDPTKRDAFAGTVEKVMRMSKEDGALAATVRDALPDHLTDSVKTSDVRAFIDKMKSFVMGDDAKDMTPNEQKLYRAKLDDAMQQMFGDKYEQVNEAFAKWASDRTKDQGLQGKDASIMNDATVDPNGPDALTETEMQAEPTRYYGAGKDKENPQFILNNDAHYEMDPNSESAHDRLMRKAEAENPDRAVSWMSAREYAQQHGIDDATLHQMTGGEPEKYGLIAAEGMQNDGRLTWKDIDAMQLGRLDANGKRQFSADYDSPSRIDTETPGVILDAQRLARTMNKKVPYADGEHSGSLQRLRRVFNEGIAAVSDHLGEAVHVPDDTVVAKRNGHSITYGMLKSLDHPDIPETFESSDTPTPELRRKLDRIQLAKDALETRMQPLSDREKAGQELSYAERRQLEKGRDQWHKMTRYERGLSDAVEARDKAERTQALQDETGRIDMKGAENVHEDALANGEAPGRQFDANGNPLDYATRSRTGPDVAMDGMQARIDSLRARAKTAGGRAVVDRAQALFDHYHDLTSTHQQSLFKGLSAPKLSDVSTIVNSLADQYADTLKTPGKSPVTRMKEWVQGVKDGTVDLTRTLQATDPKRLQAATIPLLRELTKLPKGEEAHTRVKEVVDKFNTRISDLLAQSNETDGHLAYLMTVPHAMESRAATGSTAMGQQEVNHVTALVKRMLGGSVDLHFSNTGHAGDYTPSDGMARALLRVSVHALDPQSVAYHESLHALFDQLRQEGLHDATKVLQRAAKSADVMARMREVFQNEPAVLKQIEDSHEERAAYMFQLFASGDAGMKRALTGKPKSVLARVMDMIKRTMGIWTNNERAVHIMDHFQKGEYTKSLGDRNAISRALLDPGRNKTVDHLNQSLTPLKDFATAFLTVGSERIHDYGNPALSSIVDLTRRRTFDEGTEHGYMAARRIQSYRRKNDLMNDLHSLVPEAKSEDYSAAMTAMRLRRDDMHVMDQLTPTQQKIAAVFDKHLQKTFQYMRGAGVPVKDFGFGTFYAPRMWDTAYIAAHEPEFRAMIDKYVKSGALKGNVEAMINRMMGNDGGDLTVETEGGPQNQFTKEQVLKAISAADAEQFMHKDGLRTMSLYLDQAARRAEWARRMDAFDKKTGEHVPNGELDRRLQLAKNKYGATDEQIATTRKYLDGLNGALGNDLSPKARKILANTMIYQNLRLLPLGIFSAAIDANGIMINGGTIGDSFRAFVRGVKEIRKNFQSTPKNDEAYKFAEDMGVIESVMLHHALGGTTFGLTHASPLMRKLNDAMFRFNGMEQWNTSMRVGATQAAVNFITRHAEGSHNQHSMRYLAELGLRPSDIVKGQDGRALFRREDLEAAGVPHDQAVALSNKMMFALNKWVDGAVLRPDASIKPIWMNDPYYQLFGHMKQFMFAFQETTLKRVLHEANYGNYGPTMALASFIPVMMAADAVKGLIQGGGAQPDWKDKWELGDYFGSAVQRAGLFGVGQLGIDAFKSFHSGGYGAGAIGGPTVGQLGDIMLAAEGQRAFESTAVDAMPANSLWGEWLSHLHGASAPTELNTAD